ILEGHESTGELVQDLIRDAIQDIMQYHVQKKTLSPQAIDQIFDAVSKMSGISEKHLREKKFNTHDLETLQNDLINFLLEMYELYTHQVEDKQAIETNPVKSQMMQEAQKWLMLESLDKAWKQHMLNLDHLREGISLRSWGQKNPLLEYKRESFAMFEDMMRYVRWEIVHHIFHLNIERFNKRELESQRERELNQLNLQGIENTTETVTHHASLKYEKTGRNEECPCGSGKKYKKCCQPSR
ncbi:MAG TPA: SEC-C metal-binding domain-containing protein, partial [Candidatus Babeliaceae bacterium]|nr:SEC-C metal-binding domain-containing protein [Candidatus Babeliaceae bacterium]